MLIQIRCALYVAGLASSSAVTKPGDTPKALDCPICSICLHFAFVSKQVGLVRTGLPVQARILDVCFSQQGDGHADSE